MSISSSEGVNSMERGEAAVTRQNPAQQFNHGPEVGKNKKKLAEPCSTVQSCPEVGRNKINGKTLLNSSIMSRGGQK
jgi:hypothetical protein